MLAADTVIAESSTWIVLEFLRKGPSFSARTIVSPSGRHHNMGWKLYGILYLNQATSNSLGQNWSKHTSIEDRSQLNDRLLLARAGNLELFNLAAIIGKHPNPLE